MTAILLACAAPAPAPENPATGTFADADLAGADVLFLNVDTLRGDRLGQAGYARDTLPLLGARPHVEVYGLRTTSSWTPPSTASTFTGAYPYEHGVFWTTDADNRVCNGFIDEPTFAERFQSEGFATYLATGNAFLGAGTGLDHGFDERVELGPSRKDNARQLGRSIMDWIATLPEESRFLAVMQPMNPHGPYEPAAVDLGTWADLSVLPGGYTEGGINPESRSYADAFATGDDASDAALTQAVSDLYDETILGLDRDLDRLLTDLHAAGRRNVLVVLSSDHGETLNEDGSLIFNHGRSLRPEGLDVPLWFFHPDLAGERIDCLADNRDIFPTILDLLGMDDERSSLREGCREVVLSEIWKSDTEIRGVTAEDAAWRLNWSCETGEEWATDVAADPLGLDPLDGAAAPRAEDWRRELTALVAAMIATNEGASCAKTPG